MIQSVGLAKSYGDIRAVDGVSFQVDAGECFGLLGPNGAGKTSIFKMIYGSSIPSSGELFVNQVSVSKSPRQVKAGLGVMPQDSGLDPDFTVLDNLLIYASYFGMTRRNALDRSKSLLRKMHLEEYQDRAVDQLSGGMKRRLALARALISDPEILLLDEPTTGLDPQTRLWIWNLLKDIKNTGKTLFLTTHYMEEAETLCDRLVILIKGKIVAEGKPRDLIREHIGVEVVEFDVVSGDIGYFENQFKNEASYVISQQRMQVHFKNSDEARKLMNAVNSTEIVVRKPTLNDVFLKIAGYEISD